MLRLGLNMTFDDFLSMTYSSRVLFLGSSAIPKPGNNYSSINVEVGSSYLRDEKLFFAHFFANIFNTSSYFQQCSELIGICMDSPFKNFAKSAWKHFFKIKLQVLKVGFIEKEVPAQYFSYEFCEILKSSLF